MTKIKKRIKTRFAGVYALFTLIAFFVFISLQSCGIMKDLKDTTADEVGVEINGVRWATRNLLSKGVLSTNPQKVGLFYQWNSNIGWHATSFIVNTEGQTVWNKSIPAGKTWAAENDPCPKGWRLPTQEELQSLVDAGSTWTTINGVNGRLFGTAPNQIFLPAVGYRRPNTGELADGNKTGTYRSATFGDALDMTSWGLFFGSDFGDIQGIDALGGYSVRCVCESQSTK